MVSPEVEDERFTGKSFVSFQYFSWHG
jgi:hypothetical protein